MLVKLCKNVIRIVYMALQIEKNIVTKFNIQKILLTAMIVVY